MVLLTEEQKNQFWRDGVLVVEDAVSADQLTALREEFAAWVEQSRQHDDDYGETLDGRISGTQRISRMYHKFMAGRG